MLPLTDPLWEKLDAAFRNKDIPKKLSELAEAWDNDKATSLFWEELYHQGSCYDSTYAAVPHLLGMAEPDGNRQQRREIAVFLGHVALCLPGLEHRVPLPGLSDTEEKIKSISIELLSSLPRISALCERALFENIEDALGEETYLLSGIAAAEGLLELAELLNFGSEGIFCCAACEWGYHYALYGKRIAIYVDPPRGSGYNERLIFDWEEKSPSRANGFIIPAAREDISDARVLRLLSLADRVPSPEPALLVRNFLGHIDCCKCGIRAAVQVG